MNIIDVAIVGAGPYGLSIAAHLRARGISFRIFGEPMQFWREMPPSMFLKSNSSATNIYTPPSDRLMFATYCKDRALEAFEPCAIADFARYGIFVQKAILPQVEPIEVIHIAGTAGYFEVTLSNLEKLIARRIVVAIGLKAFARMPDELLGLPPELASHTCDHSTFDDFVGQKVYVLGAGQSALQAAALLHEAGAYVEVLVRRSVIPGACYFVPDRWRIPFVRSLSRAEAACSWWLRYRAPNSSTRNQACFVPDRWRISLTQVLRWPPVYDDKSTRARDG